jgi:LPXTG-motif cell wall-anchored protein
VLFRSGSGAGLPETGSDTTSMMVLGLFLTIGGLAMLTMTRRRPVTD